MRDTMNSVRIMIYKRIKRIAMAHRKVVGVGRPEGGSYQRTQEVSKWGHCEKRGKGGRQWGSILFYYIHI
jgi:hypothetical protein